MAEKIIDLNITVEDENDCAPVIKTQQVGSVYESSAAGMSSTLSDLLIIIFLFTSPNSIVLLFIYLFIFEVPW